MCSPRIRRTFLGVASALALCLAAYSPVIGRSFQERPQPRKTLPEKLANDPVFLALKGWEAFGFISVKGSEQDALKEAAKRGAEGVELEEVHMSSGGGKVQVFKSREQLSYGTYDTYKWETGTVKFSKGYHVVLFRRAEPNAQEALDSFGWADRDSYFQSRKPATLKEILALGPVNLNSRPGVTTVLYRVVQRICEETGRNKTLVIRPRLSIPTEKVSEFYYNTRPYTVAGLLEVAGILLANGADPNVPCGEKLDMLPLDLLNDYLRWSIERYGDFSTIIEQFSDWRDLETPMTAAHVQAALVELKGMLMNPGEATMNLKSPETIADESRKPVTPRRQKSYSAPPPMTIDTLKQYSATIKTMKGDLVLDLFARDAPITVNNFVFLAREGFYDATTFYYVQLEYSISGGAKDPYYNDWHTNKHTHPLPGYGIPVELTPSPRKHGTGTIMAIACPDCSGSEFFITYQPYPNLDGNVNFPVFGELTSGMDVLQKLYIGDVIITITIQEK